jgi:hypothetical protein
MLIIFRAIIMNPIKKKLADFLSEMSKKGMEEMDPDSSCAKSLEDLDKQSLLKEDIQRISDEVSILEAVKILKLSAQLRWSDKADSDRYREDIKSMASKVLKRVEKKGGKLNLPEQCRELLISL